jgi:hypothetical protein
VPGNPDAAREVLATLGERDAEKLIAMSRTPPGRAFRHPAGFVSSEVLSATISTVSPCS